MRFYLIDRVEEICYDKYITATKCVTFADDTFEQHFFGNPVFPGSLIIEGLAQLSGMFLELMMKRKGITPKLSVLSIVKDMKFRKMVVPGDRLSMRVDVVSFREDYGIVKVKAENEGEICAEGELTLIFITQDDEKLHQSRMDVYEIVMRRAREVQ
jgi:3-hydroxyacyl-[acyl-carrier-protein] dehydratase